MSAAAQPDVLDEAFCEYLRLLDEQGDVDLDRFAERYPEVAVQLAEQIELERALRGMAGPSFSEWPFVPGDDEPEETIANPSALRPDTVNRSHHLESTTPPDGHPGRARELPVPGEFGRYRLERKLGEGAMGWVYLAHDTLLDRPVALKVPKFDAVRDAEFLARFHREAQAAATLDHPNICSVYDVGEIDDVHFIAMAFVEGNPLAKYIAGREQPVRQVVKLVRKLALALAEAHDKGVVHRDLKPDNIMVTPKGEPVVMDFGLARSLRAGDLKGTQDGNLMGTPAYMSPEQARGHAEFIGPQSDVFSLGAVLYELLTGRLPFQATGVLAMIDAIKNTEPQPVRELRPEVSDRLADVVAKMMAKPLEERFRSMQDVATTLLELLNDRATTTNEEAASSGPLDVPLAADTNPGTGQPTQPGPADKTAEPADPLAERKRTVEKQLADGHFREARAELKKLAADVGEDPDTKRWIERQLTEAKTGRQRIKRDAAAAVAAARPFLARHDYGQVVELLGDFPPRHRTPELVDLLTEAESKRERIADLESLLEQRLRSREFDRLAKPLDELLALDPRNRLAKKIDEARRTRRRTQVQVAGETIEIPPFSPDHVFQGLTRRLALLAVLVLPLTAWWLWGLLNAPKIPPLPIPAATIPVTFTIDPTLLDGNWTFLVDGEERDPEELQAGDVQIKKGGTVIVVKGDGELQVTKQIPADVEHGSRIWITIREDKVTIVLQKPAVPRAPKPTIQMVRVGATKNTLGQRARNFYPSDPNYVHSLSFTLDGSGLYSFDRDGHLKLWDVPTLRERLHLAVWPWDNPKGMLLSPSGETLTLAQAGKGGMRTYSLPEHRQLAHIRGDDIGKGMYALAGGDDVVAVGLRDAIKVYDRRTLSEIRELSHETLGEQGRPAIDISPSGDILYVGGRTLQTWSIATGQRLGVLDRPTSRISVSGGGEELLAVSADRIAVIDATALRERVSASIPTDTVSGAVFSPDGRFVVVCSGDTVLLLWRDSLAEAARITSPCDAFAISKDGRLIALASNVLSEEKGNTRTAGGTDINFFAVREERSAEPPVHLGPQGVPLPETVLLPNGWRVGFPEGVGVFGWKEFSISRDGRTLLESTFGYMQPTIYTRESTDVSFRDRGRFNEIPLTGFPHWHFSEDGLELLVERRMRDQTDIYRSTRTTKADRWGPLQPLNEVNTDAFERMPALGCGDRVLVYSDGGSLFRMKRKTKGEPFSGRVETGVRGTNACLEYGGRTLFYTASGRVWMRTRESDSGVFGDAVDVLPHVDAAEITTMEIAGGDLYIGGRFNVAPDARTWGGVYRLRLTRPDHGITTWRDPALTPPPNSPTRPLDPNGPPGLVKRIPVGPSAPKKLATTPDGSRLMVFDLEGEVTFWDTNSGALLKQLDSPGHGDVIDDESFAFKPEAGPPAIYSLDSFSPLVPLSRSKDGLFSVRYGSALVSDGLSVRLWDLRTRTSTPVEVPVQRIRMFAVNEDKFLYRLNDEDPVRIRIRLRGDENERILAPDNLDVTTPTRFQPGRDELIARLADRRTIVALSDRTGEVEQTFSGHDGIAYGFRFLAGGRYMLSYGDDHTVRIWDSARGTELWKFSDRVSGCCYVALTSNERFAFVCRRTDVSPGVWTDYDPCVDVWRLPTVAELDRLAAEKAAAE